MPVTAEGTVKPAMVKTRVATAAVSVVAVQPGPEMVAEVAAGLMPAGRVSIKLSPVNAKLPLGLVIVNTRLVVAPASICGAE